MKYKIKSVSSEDLDLMPVMNLFSILIPFLLSVAVFQKIAIVDVNMPDRSHEGGDIILEPEMNLGMSVFLTQTAIKLWAWDRQVFESTISWREVNEEMVPTLELEGEVKDALPHIGEKLVEISNRGADMPDAESAVLVAETDVKTQSVIQMMDLLKDSGFSALNLARLGAP